MFCVVNAKPSNAISETSVNKDPLEQTHPNPKPYVCASQNINMCHLMSLEMM